MTNTHIMNKEYEDLRDISNMISSLKCHVESIDIHEKIKKDLSAEIGLLYDLVDDYIGKYVI